MLLRCKKFAPKQTFSKILIDFNKINLNSSTELKSRNSRC